MILKLTPKPSKTIRLLLMILVMFYCTNTFAQCTITATTNVNTLSCGTSPLNSCGGILYIGDGTTAMSLKMNANLDLSCLGPIRLIVRNNAILDFSGGNYDLKLATGSSIEFNSGSVLDGGGSCSASDRIYIGSSLIASCNGGGGASTNFANLLTNGGYNASCSTYSLTSVSVPTTQCLSTAIVTVNGLAAGLPVGTYTVTYNRNDPWATGLTASMTVTTAGTGSFTATGLTNPNNAGTKITVTKLASGPCSNTISSIDSNTFVMRSSLSAPTLDTPFSSCPNYTVQVISQSPYATNYYLDVNTSNTFGAGTYLAGYQNKDLGTTIQHAITGLIPGTSYYYRFRSTNTCGTTTNSSTGAFVAPGSAVAAIGGGAVTVCQGSTTPAFTNTTSGGTWSITPGTGTATITSGGVVTGSNSGTVTVVYSVTISGCTSTVTKELNVNALPVATFSYTATPYCSNATNPSPTFSGGGVAGVFSSTAGLNFVSTATGQINLATSTAGTYTVTNTIAAAGGCGVVTATSSVTIKALPVATFSYTATPYCSNATNPSPTFSGGGVAGVFSSTAGLNFVNTATGQINLATSTAGTYTVTNTIAAAGGCGVVTATSSSITIYPMPVITTQPITQLDCEGRKVDFEVIDTGIGLTYSWQYKRPLDSGYTTIIASTSNVNDFDKSKIGINNVGSAQFPNGTLFQVIISNSTTGCSVTSTAATLLVNEITGISPSTTNVVKCYGANYDYTVSTSTPSPGMVVSYQWKTNASGSWNNVVDGTHFSGAQTEKLEIISGTPAESAEYKVQVIFTNSGSGCTVTTALTRRITFLPEVTAPVATITQPDCVSSTGSVVLSSLPSTGTWTLTRSPDAVTTTGTGTSTTISGLAAGTYTYTVSNGTCTSLPSNTVTINTNAAAIWNGSSWINGPPNVTQALIFSGNYTSSGDLIACSCTVNAGVSVSINSGHTLTLTNGLTVEPTSSITFEDSASLVQKNNVSNSGNITYKRNFTGGELDYTYWSSPVASQNLYTLSPLTKLDKFYSFNSSINNWVGENPYTTAMIIGKGYIIRGMPPTSLIPTGFNTNSFVGVPNNGDYSIGVVGVQISNLIGNPYPSALYADQFLVDNQFVIDGKITFWTHNTAIQLASNITNGTAGSGAYAYTSDDYASYNLTGGVGTGFGIGNTTGTPPIEMTTNKPTGKIAAGQSFFTKSKVASGTVVFKNSMRFDGTPIPLNNSNFYKTTNPNSKKTNIIEKNRVWLNLTNIQGAFKQTLIGYITGATNDNDNLYDAKTSDGNKYVDFYTVNQGQNLTIQGRALPFDQNDEVPIGYRTTINGAFTINIDQTDGFLGSQPIFIEDKLTNTVFNLKTGNYTFNTVSGTFNERFVLRFTGKTLGFVDEAEVNDEIIVLYSNNYKTLIIRNNDKNTTVNLVTLYNMTGQKIAYWDVKGREQSSIQIPIKDLPSDIYIVKVKTTKGESSKKIIIK